MQLIRDRSGINIWAASAYLSALVKVSALGGNGAMFALHPARHWAVLESVETLASLSMIPVALSLCLVNRSSRLSMPFTLVGILGMLLVGAVSAAFAVELLSFGNGGLATYAFAIGWAMTLIWLVGANVVAWQLRTLPRGLALSGVLSAATGTVLYPLWATWLGYALGTRVSRSTSGDFDPD